MSEPFFEHPTGEFDSVVIAMEGLVHRLRALPHWEDWITLTAQGQGPRAETYEFAEVRLLGDKLDVGNGHLDLQRILGAAQTSESSLVTEGNHYSLAGASPREAARLLDAIFRYHFHVRPFPDEGDEYAFGAEWL